MRRKTLDNGWSMQWVQYREIFSPCKKLSEGRWRNFRVSAGRTGSQKMMLKPKTTIFKCRFHRLHFGWRQVQVVISHFIKFRTWFLINKQCHMLNIKVHLLLIDVITEHSPCTFLFSFSQCTKRSSSDLCRDENVSEQ